MADVVKAVRRELVLTLDRWKSKMCAGELAEVILASPELRARLSQAGAGGVVVKPLEWREEFRDGTFVKLTALTPFGGYEASSEFTALTNKGPMTALPRWKGPLDSSSHEATSLDQAKAAAQADYSARILAALAPSPSAGERAPMKMLVDNDWLREKIESDPDDGDCTAGRLLATPVQPTASVEDAIAALQGALEKEREQAGKVRYLLDTLTANLNAERVPIAELKAAWNSDDYIQKLCASLTPAPTQGDGR